MSGLVAVAATAQLATSFAAMRFYSLRLLVKVKRQRRLSMIALSRVRH